MKLVSEEADSAESIGVSSFTSSSGSEGSNSDKSASTINQRTTRVTIASSLSSFAVNANVTIVDNTVNTIALGVAHDRNINFTEDITDGTSRVRRSAPSRSSDCFSWGRIRSTGQRDGLNVAVGVNSTW